ncbi:hypothetical protein EDE05_109140 [Neorhizobium sp. R1-B]|uniref:glycosyltransferase n=1 Tax=unclassified Neorhizobium TaxID=2629175 RepID=UPI001052E9EF|nr:MULTISPECIES: glycosyltransferase [unclassified Neorhizobium]TCV67182.1 hypothetical protein EDE09_11437 [Neorhizobium sp. S3-V5DH]TDX82211.1 hypothetical protein EDE05_109140 [Neorhizobium sp. R1-B]
MITIVCMKWGAGFTAMHVNALYAGVLRHMEEPFEFVCLTDDGFGLASGIAVRPIPELALPEGAWRKGCWPKIGVFSPDLFPSAEAVLFLDLDVIIQRSLAPFLAIVRERRHLVIQREWNPDLWSLLPMWLRPDRGAQSSVFGFCPSTAEAIFSDFAAHTAERIKSFKNDQTYLTQTVRRRSYWPAGFCVSFKRSCTKYFPLNLLFPKVRQPSKARIVVFHGRPRPWETMVREGERWGSKRRFGIGPVPWIRQYFDQGDAMLTSLHAINKGGPQLVSEKAPASSPRPRSHGNRESEEGQQAPIMACACGCDCSTNNRFFSVSK